MSKASDLDILSAVSNSTRLEILSLLEDANLKQVQLSKKIGLSIQALQKHIDKLLKSGLVEKNLDAEYSLSPIGRFTLEQIPSFQFLSKHRKYFEGHTFDGIPKKLLARIGDLTNGEFIDKQMKGWQRNRDMCLANQKWLSAVTITMPVEFFDIAKEKLKQGVQYKVLFGKNTYVPKGFYKYPARKKEWQNAIKTGQVKEKFVEHVPITTVNTENESTLVFSNKKLGEPDTIEQFSSDDTLFKQWCMDLFDYYWNEVPCVAPFRLEER